MGIAEQSITDTARPESARDYIERYTADRATFRSDDAASTTRSFANMEDDLQKESMPRTAANRFAMGLRVFVILVQPCPTVLECDEPGGGEHARLPHASAKHLPD